MVNRNNASFNSKGGKGSYSQGVFMPRNPQKCVTPKNVYRSSWEKDFMVVCDENPSISQWGSEPFYIPYINPITQTVKQYWPDFIVVYLDRKGNQTIDLIEIKPLNESVVSNAKTKKNQLALAVNHAKWEAAYAFAAKNGMRFRVMTEKDLYFGGKKK